MQASVTFQNGAAWIDIDGVKTEPVAYRSFWPQGQTIKNFSDREFQFYGVFPSGILCSLKVPYSQFGEVWTGDGQYNWDNLRAQVDQFVTNAPQARFALMVHLDTRDWFLEENPGCADSFNRLVQTAGWQKWRLAATRYLRDLLDYLDRHYPERVFAVFLFAGGTCEWFSRYPAEGLEPNPIAEQVYRNWYGPGAAIPVNDELRHTTDGVFRDPVTDANAIRYWHFHNEVIADTIAWFALQVKEHTNGSRLVGVFYGYLMTLPNQTLVPVGHNALSRVLCDENIDLFFSPASYRLRRLDSTSGFQLIIDSLRLHKKLYFHEVDNTTHLANNNPYAGFLQKTHHKRMEDEQQTVAYSRRETALAMMHGQGYWWFDMFAGWYDDDHLMDELARIRDVTRQFWQGDMRSSSEVAVFVDQESNFFVGFDTCIHECLVIDQAEELGRMGTPWDCYVADDLCHPDLADDYKLYIFLNLFKPSEQIQNQIRRLREQGKSLFFLYAPGYISDNGFSQMAMQALTDLPLVRLDPAAGQIGTEKPGRGTATGQIRTTLSGKEQTYGFTDTVAPLFTLTPDHDKRIDVLGQYADNAQPALVLRQRSDAYDAWSGAGLVPGAVLRELARKAGVFIYSETDDPIYANRGLFGLYTHQAGQRTVRFPNNVILQNVYQTERQLTTHDGCITLDCSDNEMHLFMINAR
ncbi:MAG: hypothetical protein SCM11_07545 [Bacillota bacterium]|nr:hypothetical protein [Bacillota bacterium]